MTKEKNRAWLEIDLDALAYNFKNIKSALKPETKTLCVIKADAYGHGAGVFAKELSYLGADAFAVATNEEALFLRETIKDKDIMILGYAEPVCYNDLVENNITLTIFDYNSAKKLSEIAQSLNKTAKIHIKIDTGMTRIGYEPNEKSADEIIKISSLPCIYVEGMFSHFAKADETDKTYTKMQFEKFMYMDALLKERGLDIKLKHIANSAGIIDHPEYQLDMVRPGIILYGMYPSSEVKKDKVDLMPVMSVKAHITRIKDAEKGTFVSYGGIYETNAPEKIATVPLGYADGFFRLLSEKAQMIANGKIVPVVGRICMDQCMIDVTSVNNINVGDTVTVMGREGDISIYASDLAKTLGTISYEILCSFGMRLNKVYTKKQN